MKVTIKGNGNQAPYGIGEIIDILPVSHWRKIQRLVGSYYNAPTMECAGCHERLDWTYDNQTYRVTGLSNCKCGG